MTGRTAILGAAAAALILAAACGRERPGTGSGDAQGTAGSGTLTVFAAASLKATFTTIGEDFENAHPGTTVVFNFAGSSDLASQIQQGAPADVFASADTRNMDKAEADRLLAGEPVDFASNRLQIAVPQGNPAGVSDLADLARPGVRVVVCAPEVPCGAATNKVEAAAGLTLHPVSEEGSVTDVLGKVATGEADAGLVYVTDVRSAGDAVVGVPFPESAAGVNTYPIAALSDSEHLFLAKEFVTAVTGPQGQAVLAAAGFDRPDAAR